MNRLKQSSINTLLPRLIAGLLFLLLAACAGGDTTSSGAVAAPILQTNKSPADVVSDFLNAWNVKDYPAMYAALSPQSQGSYTLPVFQAIYEDTATKMSLSDLSFTLHETRIQGAAAAVTYDLVLTSPIFGTIEDKGRTMRLIQKPGGWGIAWSNMDIFDGLASGARLEVNARREPRGNIYDRNGQLLVEENGTMILLYVAKQNMSNVEDCLTLLANVLRVQRFDLAQIFANNNPDTVFYVGEIDPEVDQARGGELDSTCGVRRFDGTTRRYVGYGAAVHVTGYIGPIPATEVERWTSQGYNSGDLIGLTGVEAAYEKELSGTAEQGLRIIAPSGVVLRELAGKSGSPPQSVTLTIDRDLQLAVAQAMSDAYNYAEPNWAAPNISPGGGAVVLDVNTGAVLALVSYPFFDPNIFNPNGIVPDRGAIISRLATDTRLPFTNRVTQQQYFPGSTFKIITTTAAAAEGLVSPTENFFCDLTWDGRPFGDTLPARADWRKTDGMEAAGDITISQALSASCNPFFYQMGARLYRERGENALVSYARKLGLGSKTGLEPIMLEVAGNINTPTSIEQAISSAVGQGEIQVTIIQMARMVAAIANGGTVYKPYLVQKVGGMNGETPLFEAQPTVVSETGLTQETLDIVRAGMCGAVSLEELGTAYVVFADSPGYPVCGKTGTAQTGRREPHGWFVAFAPPDDPQIAVVVMTEFSREGSETSAPIVRRILDAYFGFEPILFPDWWAEGPYQPLDIPVGETGG